MSVFADLGVDGALEGVKDAQERMDSSVEVGGFPAQFVDALGGGGRAPKDGRLHLFDVVFQAGHHRGVVVDDLVQDGPQGATGAFLEELGAAFKARPGAAQVTGGPLSDRDQEPRRQEDGHLAEVDLFAVIVVAGGADHGEERVPFVKLLHLGPEMKRLGVLDGQVMQPEAPLHFAQLVGVGLKQSYPDKAALRRFGG